MTAAGFLLQDHAVEDLLDDLLGLWTIPESLGTPGDRTYS
jgi:hypothetical protein